MFSRSFPPHFAQEERAKLLSERLRSMPPICKYKGLGSYIGVRGVKSEDSKGARCEALLYNMKRLLPQKPHVSSDFVSNLWGFEKVPDFHPRLQEAWPLDFPTKPPSRASAEASFLRHVSFVERPSPSNAGVLSAMFFLKNQWRSGESLVK